MEEAYNTIGSVDISKYGKSKAIHVKIYCKNCGKLLHHERVERAEEDNPLAQYVGIAIDPWCEECLGKKP